MCVDNNILYGGITGQMRNCIECGEAALEMFNGKDYCYDCHTEMFTNLKDIKRMSLQRTPKDKRLKRARFYDYTSNSKGFKRSRGGVREFS